MSNKSTRTYKSSKSAKSKNTVSNFARARQEQDERESKSAPIDRIADWIADRSRLVRTLICAIVALFFTASFAGIFFSALYNTDPRRINFGPITSETIPFYALIFLAILGMVFYWVGWRLMIGFDFEDKPLRPGRAAAYWLISGILVGFVTILVFLAVREFALQP